MNTPYSLRIGTPGMPNVVFGHGWGRSHHDFLHVAKLIAPFADSFLLDLPGFGKSKRPDDAWGSRDYAAYLTQYLQHDLGLQKFIWVGHSFSGRIGLCLASRQESAIEHLIIVAGAGLPRKLSACQQIQRAYGRMCFAVSRKWISSEEALFVLEKRYGSVDYVQSRVMGMRDIFLRVLSENLSPEIENIRCRSSLIYGGLDTETPPEIGKELHKLIPDSTYVECEVLDHLSLLDRGRYQITLAIKEQIRGSAN